METQPPAGLSSMTIEDLVGELSAKTGQDSRPSTSPIRSALSYQGQSVNYKAIYLYSTWTSLRSPGHRLST